MKKKKKRKTKADLFAETIKHNIKFHYGGLKKHKCRKFEEIIKELEDNDLYDAVYCSECNTILGLIAKTNKMKKDPTCPLCKLVFEDNIITQYYGEFKNFRIVDCLTCSKPEKSIPMAVYRSHISQIPEEQKIELKEYFENKFGNGYFDDSMRQIKSHYHAHWR